MSESMTHCAQCLDQLDDYRRGMLSDADKLLFERHLVECPECGVALQEAEAIGELLRTAASAELPEAVDFAAVRERAWAAMEHEETVRVLDVPARKRSRPPLTWMMAAAAIVVVVGYTVVSSRMDSLSEGRRTAAADRVATVSENGPRRSEAAPAAAFTAQSQPDRMDVALQELKRADKMVLADGVNMPEDNFGSFETRTTAEKREIAGASRRALPASSVRPDIVVGDKASAPASEPAKLKEAVKKVSAVSGTASEAAPTELYAQSNYSTPDLPVGSASPAAQPAPAGAPRSIRLFANDAEKSDALEEELSAGREKVAAVDAKDVEAGRFATYDSDGDVQMKVPARGGRAVAAALPSQPKPTSGETAGMSKSALSEVPASAPVPAAPPALSGKTTEAKPTDGNWGLENESQVSAAAAPAATSVPAKDLHNSNGNVYRYYSDSKVEIARSEIDSRANLETGAAAVADSGSAGAPVTVDRLGSSGLRPGASASRASLRRSAIEESKGQPAPESFGLPQIRGGTTAQSAGIGVASADRDLSKKASAQAGLTDEKFARKQIASADLSQSPTPVPEVLGEAQMLTANTISAGSMVQKVDDSWYFKAEDQRLGGKPDEAIASYERVLSEQPGTAAAAKAQLHIADLQLEQRKDKKAALAAYKACLAPDLARHYDEATLQAIRLRISQLESAAAGPTP